VQYPEQPTTRPGPLPRIRHLRRTAETLLPRAERTRAQLQGIPQNHVRRFADRASRLRAEMHIFGEVRGTYGLEWGF